MYNHHTLLINRINQEYSEDVVIVLKHDYVMERKNIFCYTKENILLGPTDDNLIVKIRINLSKILQRY